MSPKSGDAIMIFKPKWANLIMSGVKKLEVRSCKYKGNYWIGCKEKIIGKCTLDQPLQIKTTNQWKKLRPLHCCEDNELPYKKTWVLQISNVESVLPHVEYTHPRGAIGIVRYK